jgi:GDP-4-dehydro-6-deoxy-D-mannose reductase
MKLLVTGVAGFVGGHMVRYLEREQPSVEVSGLVRPGTKAPQLPPAVSLVEADLEDAEAVEALLEEVRPDRIIHLAAQSSVHALGGLMDPARNVHGLLPFRGRRKRPVACILVWQRRGVRFGAAQPAACGRAAAPQLARRSKVAQGFLALQYSLSWDGIVRSRSFSHTGPGAETCRAASPGRSAVEAAGGGPSSMSEPRGVGIATCATSWGPLVPERGDPGGVATCTAAASGRELLRSSSTADIDVEIRLESERLRPSDVPALVGDPSKLKAATGWEPAIPLEETLSDLLQHWREKLQEQASPEGQRGPM